MRKLKSQRGFSFFEILLLILLILLLIFLFWYVWSQNKKSGNEGDSGSSIQPAKDESAKKKPAKEAKYLTITEKGIKFKLNDRIDDAYYFINKSGYVYFSVHKFDNVKGAEDCTAKGKLGQGSGLGALIEAKVGQDDGHGGVWTLADINNAKLVKVGSTYYGFEANDQIYCWDTTDPALKDYGTLVKGLKSSFADALATTVAAN